MSGRLHIVLPVYNRRETTVAFVDALRRQTYQDFKLVLVDDGSTDGTAEAVRHRLPAVEVLTGTGDWWWAGSLDRACRRLSETGVRDEDVLLLINDDVVIGPDFLAQALAELAQHADTLLLARQVDVTTGAEIDHGGGVRVDLAELRFAAAVRPEDINCLPTRGLFMRWREFLRTGGFVPDRLPHYLSDYEFTLRARSRGLALRVATKASLGVKEGQTGRAMANLFDEPRVGRFRLLFSHRYKDNPLAWSAFVSLAVPRSRRPYLWLKVWLNFGLTVVRCVLIPVPRADLR